MRKMSEEINQLKSGADTHKVTKKQRKAMPKNKSEGVALINETDQRLQPEK